MIIKHFGKNLSINSLRNLCNTDREGTSIKAIINVAEKLGLYCLGINFLVNKNSDVSKDIPLLAELQLPIIVYWNNNHFVVVYKIKQDKIFIADPAIGKLVLNNEQFEKHIFSEKNIGLSSSCLGKAIVFESTDIFSKNPIFENQKILQNINFLKKYISKQKKGLLLLFFIITLELAAQIISPFLTKYSFDSGIMQKNINVLLLVLIVQLISFVFSSSINYINSLLSNKIAQKINIAVTTDFICKIFRIPIKYFQQQKTSDFIYKIFDISRIESFLTYNFVSIVLAILSTVIFSIIAIYFDFITFLIIFGTYVLNTVWTFYSLQKRKILDYERFDIKSDSHKIMIEIFEGIYDIKINKATNTKIASVITNQKHFFANNFKFIKISQLLSIGGGLINNIGNGIIMFYTAYLTVNDILSIGEMAAIQLVSVQLFSALSSVTSSLSIIQETKFSIERVSEIQLMNEEKSGGKTVKSPQKIIFKNVSFAYSDISNNVLSNLNFNIEIGKTTAIVGLSGSGKSTLLKLALGFIQPTYGEILIDNVSLKDYDMENWRTLCGMVLSDGFVFTDSIKNNVIMNVEKFDDIKFTNSLKSAEIYDFINELPKKEETIIGREGLTLSSGQKQRILIARMFYKNPEYVFIDEATNSLDFATEKKIMNNLDYFFNNKTQIIVAHRLSTVKNADKIVVLNNGKIIETGTHNELVRLKGEYYYLVKNQLELENS
jgi:ATP-binding cassette subfamily B protein